MMVILDRGSIFQGAAGERESLFLGPSTKNRNCSRCSSEKEVRFDFRILDFQIFLLLLLDQVFTIIV